MVFIHQTSIYVFAIAKISLFLICYFLKIVHPIEPSYLVNSFVITRNPSIISKTSQLIKMAGRKQISFVEIFVNNNSKKY